MQVYINKIRDILQASKDCGKEIDSGFMLYKRFVNRRITAPRAMTGTRQKYYPSPLNQTARKDGKAR